MTRNTISNRTGAAGILLIRHHNSRKRNRATLCYSWWLFQVAGSIDIVKKYPVFVHTRLLCPHRVMNVVEGFMLVVAYAKDNA
jgi:hypothetical protein